MPNAQPSLRTSQPIDFAGSHVDPAFAMQANTLPWFVLSHGSVKQCQDVMQQHLDLVRQVKASPWQWNHNAGHWPSLED